MAAAALSLGLAAASPAEAAPTKITLAWAGANGQLAALVAKDKGFFDKRDLDVTLRRIQTSTMVPAGLVSGDFQIGLGTVPLLLQANEGGLDLVVAAGMVRFRKDHSVIGLVARTGETIKSAADLKGKKVGLPGMNGIFDILFREWLSRNDVAAKDVTTVEAALAPMSDMLKSQTLDAVAVLEPFRSRIIAQGTGYQVVDYIGAINPDVLAAFWMASRAWANANPEAVRAFREAVSEATDYIAAHPDEAKAIEKKHIGFTSDSRPSLSMAVSEADIGFFVSIMQRLDLLRKQPAVADLIMK
jgi:NitT/TauT family transport system substrate-binding protein